MISYTRGARKKASHVLAAGETVQLGLLCRPNGTLRRAAGKVFMEGVAGGAGIADQQLGQMVATFSEVAFEQETNESEIKSAKTLAEAYPTGSDTVIVLTDRRILTFFSKPAGFSYELKLAKEYAYQDVVDVTTRNIGLLTKMFLLFQDDSIARVDLPRGQDRPADFVATFHRIKNIPHL